MKRTMILPVNPSNLRKYMQDMDKVQVAFPVISAPKFIGSLGGSPFQKKNFKQPFSALKSLNKP